MTQALEELADDDLEQESVRAPDPLLDRLEPPLAAAAATAAHLYDYLQRLDMAELGEPLYVGNLTRKSVPAGPLDLIYAIDGGLFVHIRNDPNDARDQYYSIEPAMFGETDELFAQIEPMLLDYVDELEAVESDEERIEVLGNAVDESVSRDGAKGGKRGGLLPFGRKSSGGNKLVATEDELAALRYLVLRDKIGMGVLQPLLLDPNIEDISCSGIGKLFLEHKICGALTANINFTTMEELDTFVIRLSEKIKKPVSYRNPISDATLPDGSRINIVFGGDVSTRGSNFTIRKFNAVPMSILDVIDSGGISFEMAAYLSLLIGEGMNLFVSGETASGKTTLLNALTMFYPAAAKIVTIEDTPELQVPHPNWTREVVRGTMSDDGSAVTMFTLLKASLRQRPNAILIGEIRGEEGAIAFQAMQTGHPVASTFHASSVEKLIQRMTGNPINVPKTYIDNLNVVCIASAVRLPNGKPGRRIISINELVAYDSASDSFSFIETYRWLSHNDTFEATGHMNSYILEHKVAPKLGIDPTNKRAIYNEVDKRARLFEQLLKTGYTDFNDLYKAFSQAQRQGLV